MTFDEIEHTGPARSPQTHAGECAVTEASIRLERATSDSDLDARLLAAWLITASWYANWVENLNCTVVSRRGQVDCPNIDLQAPARKLLDCCKVSLGAIPGAQHTSWQVRAWSDTEQCPGVFGAARLQMCVSVTDVELVFDGQLLERSLAHEMLDTLHGVASALQHENSFVVADLVERARPEHSNSELLGKLHGVDQQDVLEAFDGHVCRDPDKVAICDAGRVISYGQLSADVRKLAAKLAGQGVRPGSRVALRMSRSGDFVVAALAVLSLDAIYIPIDPQLPPERSKLMLEDARVGWVVEGDAVVAQGLSLSAAQPDDEPRCGYVLFTSGTTGRPKGVLISRASLSYYASVAMHSFGLTSQDKVLQFATVSFDASVEEIYCCLMAGGTLVIRDSSVDLQPASFLQFLDEQQITFLDLPTGYWRELSLACTSQHLRFPSCVNLVVIGGEALYKSDIHNWYRLPAPRPTLINSYGPTETTVVTALQRVRRPDTDDDSRNDISIGRPIAGSRIVLLDRFDKPAPLGAMGQICISSPGVAEGYLHNPDMTAEKFFVRVENDQSLRRYYKSGDLGRIGRDGALEYHGRMDNVVKRQGFRISLGEIESIVRTLPEVSDCCVFMTDAGSDSKLLCVVQLMPGMKVSQLALRQQLMLDLPSYMVPNSFILLDEIPRNLAGKIDYNAVRGLAMAVVDATSRDLSCFFAGSEIAREIQSTLGGRELNWDASLVENGADSLEIVRLAMLLQKHSGHEWPLSTLYEYPSMGAILNDVGGPEIAKKRPRDFKDWRYAELERLSGLIRHGAPRVSCAKDGILVTGATGLLGRHVVRALLKSTQRPIYCLVRSPMGSTESPDKKLTQLLGVRNEALRRLHIIVGDLDQNDVGLDEKGLYALQRSVSDIVHCAADTNMLSPYSKLVTTNVQGSLNLINLALESKASFHFISSLALFDTKPSLLATPETKIMEVDNVASGYLQSKWMTEMLLEHCATSGLKATIYRCGRLWGSSMNLEEARNDYVYQFLSVCQRIGQFPIMPMQLEICPADRIAEQIASSVVSGLRQSVSGAKIYHLCSNKSYTMDEIYAAMRHRLKDFSLVNSSTWLAALNARIVRVPEDAEALRIFAVVKSLSLSGCIDDLAITEAIASRECWEHGQPFGLTPEQMIEAVLAGSARVSSHAQAFAH